MSTRASDLTRRHSVRHVGVAAVGVIVAVLQVGVAMSAVADRCPALATLPSIECRATALVGAMDTAAELGSLDRTSPAIAETAEAAIADAAFTCHENARRAHFHAVADLRKAASLLDRTRRRLAVETRHAKLDPAIAHTYVTVLVPLVADLRTAREQLVCPGSFDNVCGDGIPQTGFAGGPGQEECDDGNTVDGDGCSAQCLLEPVLDDLSAFHAFTFSRESALGFCPPTNALFDANVTIDPAGAAHLRWSILRDDVGCGTPPFQCVDRDEFARVLTSDEVARLRDAFRTVRIVDATPNGCADVAFDPCLVDGFAWDDFHASDFLCHAPLLGTEEVARILGVVTDLAQCGDCGEGGGGGTTGAVAYQCLTAGNPGIPGDRTTVADTNGAFTLSEPFSMRPVTGGLTLTVDLAPTELPHNVIVQANFRSLGRPLSVCGVGISPDGSSTTISVDPDGRVTLDISDAALERAVQVVRTAPRLDCADVQSVSDLALDGFYAYRELSSPPDFRTEPVQRLDAVAVGIGENVVPTAATPPPACAPW